LAALQVAEGEGRGVLGGGKLGAALAGRVVQAQHLVAAAAVLAAGQGLALEAGVDGGVVVAVEPGGRVAGGPGTAAGATGNPPAWLPVAPAPPPATWLCAASGWP